MWGGHLCDISCFLLVYLKWAQFTPAAFVMFHK